MLLYSPQLPRLALEELADLLSESGRLEPGEKTAAVDQEVDRLANIYGRRV
jgi:hypothetical protein